MKILFVSSGNSGDAGILVKNQAESLINKGVEIHFYLIKGKGFFGYLKNVPQIRKIFLEGKFDLIHAHYSLSAFAATLAGRFPLVVSLMGSDVYLSFFFRIVCRLFYYTSWDTTVVKTERMKQMLKLNKAIVLPNGVNIDIFRPIPQQDARKEIGYNSTHKLIIFVADPKRKEKNFNLAEKSVKVVKEKMNEVELMVVNNVPNIHIPFYLNAADVLLLTSNWEGSVNVVKEAMACNLPIVSTDVGDVQINLQGVNNCFICKNNPESIADGLFSALNNNSRTNGRIVLLKKGLDSESIAYKLIKIYESIINKK